MKTKTIPLELPETTLQLLSVLGDPAAVLAQLADHAQQGVYRPGSWERPWLEQAFGTDWQDHLQPGDPYGRPNCEHIFQKPIRARTFLSASPSRK